MASKIIDLTLPYDENIAGFSWEDAKVLEKDGWNARDLHIYSHAGTHMDAPRHFGVTEESIDEIPLESCRLQAWVAHLPETKAGSLIHPEQLGEEILENLQPGEGLLLHTGWSVKLGTDAYRNALPRVSKALANWCISRKVALIGVEPPSVADVNNLEEVTLIHQLLLGNKIIIVEGLTNLNSLPNSKVDFWAVPLKIKKGDGAPCRAFVLAETE
ncbi:MAG: cyclase family protein [Bacteroidota bacterium]